MWLRHPRQPRQCGESLASVGSAGSPPFATLYKRGVQGMYLPAAGGSVFHAPFNHRRRRCRRAAHDYASYEAQAKESRVPCAMDEDGDDDVALFLKGDGKENASR